MSDREIMDAKFGGLKYNQVMSKLDKPKQLPDAKKHQIISFIKSGIRILGYGLLIVNVPIAVGVDIKSKNMGSLREATITLRANSEKQFSLIDTLYCRIGYTMFLEWGNSVYFNNDSEFVSNPLEAGVPSLIYDFLNPGENACFDTNTGLLSKIESKPRTSLAVIMMPLWVE